MAQAPSEPRVPLPWELRLGSWIPLPAFAAGAVITLAVFLAYAAEQWLHGFPAWSPEPGSRFPYSAETHAAAMAAVLFGYFVGAYRYVYASTLPELERAGAVAPFRDIARGNRMAGGVAVIIFYVWLTFAVGPVSTGNLSATVQEGAVAAVLTFLLMIWVAARLAYFTLRGARTATDVAAARLEIDLWNPDMLAPFGRIGLRLSLVWIVGVTLFWLMLLTDPNPEDVPPRWPILVIV